MVAGFTPPATKRPGRAALWRSVFAHSRAHSRVDEAVSRPDEPLTDNVSMTEMLLHICSRTDWAHAQKTGTVSPPSLSTEGFVHLSTREQVHLPADRLFAGRTDLVLLHVDPSSLEDPIRYEPGVPGDPEAMRFPHLYGPLPVSAVVEVADFLPGPDGRFAPPTPR